MSSLNTAISWLRRVSLMEAVSLCCLVIFTYRQRWVMDDATIYFRYIDNWLFLQRGLVFNAGEYVEGFTSPLWLLLLAAGRLLPVDYWTLTLWLGLGCALGAGLLCIALNRRLAGGLPPANLPLALLAGHYGVQSHFTSGLETGLVQLFGVLTALWVVSPGSRLLSLLLGLSPLVRPELALVVVVACLLRLWRVRQVPWALALSAGLTSAAWLAFRVYYYADLLPNTFYLKAETNWAQGGSYLALELIGGWGVVLAVGVASVLALFARRGAPAAEVPWARTQMLLLAAVTALWTVRIGGDMSYHRFFAFSSVLAVCASGGLLERGLRDRQSWLRLVAPALALALALASYPAQVLSAHPLSSQAHSLQWKGIEDGMWHRQQKDIRPSPERRHEDDELRRTYAQIEHPEVHDEYAIRAFCHWSFMRPQTHVVHTYGLTDALLARVNSTIRRPGHRNLWDHARDLNLALLALPNDARGAGVYQRAADMRKVAPWIARSLPSIALIDAKVHNHHRFFENLKLALTPVPRIAP